MFARSGRVSAIKFIDFGASEEGHTIPAPLEMTSVLYGGSLNYQAGNPVRQEIMQVNRAVVSLRKQVELLTEENLVYRKHLMKLVQATENGGTEFTKDLMALSEPAEPAPAPSQGSGGVRGGVRR